MTNKEPKEVKCRDCGKMEAGAHACRRVSKEEKCDGTCEAGQESTGGCPCSICHGNRIVRRNKVTQSEWKGCPKCNPDKVVSSPTWEESEREAWKDHYLFTPNEKLLALTAIADYWIERIRVAREEARSAALEEAKIRIGVQTAVYGTEMDAYNAGIDAALSELSALIDQK